MTVEPRQLPDAEAVSGEFVCPRCGERVVSAALARYWNEWGQICYCPVCGSWDPRCAAFANGPERSSRPALPDQDRRQARAAQPT